MPKGVSTFAVGATARQNAGGQQLVDRSGHPLILIAHQSPQYLAMEVPPYYGSHLRNPARKAHAAELRCQQIVQAIGYCRQIVLPNILGKQELRQFLQIERHPVGFVDNRVPGWDWQRRIPRNTVNHPAAILTG